MRLRFSRAFVVGLTALVFVKAASRGQSVTSRTVLFVIEGQEKGKIPASSTIEPLAMIENGRFEKTPEYDYKKQKESDAAYEDFEKEYFASGRTYPLLIGGAEKGFVTVGKPVDDESCISLSATATASVPLSNAQLALAATAINGVGVHVDWRHAVTAQERAEFLSLVTKILEEQKVQRASESTIKIDNIRSTRLSANGPSTLIGSATLSRKSGIHHVFLVAVGKTAEYKIAIRSYHFARDEDDASATIENLVEQLDVDDDGKDEIVTINTHYESWDFTIYKERDGKWQRVYEGAGGGC